MTHHQCVQVGTETEKDEAILDARVFGIIDQQGMLIRKHRLGLLEGDPMLSHVVLILPFIPLKCNATHIYNICTLYVFVKPRARMSNTSISCGRVRRPGGPARRVLRRRRDGSGRQLHAELDLLYRKLVPC